MVVPEKADSGLCNTIILPSPSPRPPWPWVLVLSTFKAGETRPGFGLRPRPVSLLNRNIGKTHGTSKRSMSSFTTRAGLPALSGVRRTFLAARRPQSAADLEASRFVLGRFYVDYVSLSRGGRRCEDALRPSGLPPVCLCRSRRSDGPRSKCSASLHYHTSFDRIVSLLQLGPLYATPRRSPLVDPRLHAYGPRPKCSASLHDHTSFNRIVSLLQLGPPVCDAQTVPTGRSPTSRLRSQTGLHQRLASLARSPRSKCSASLHYHTSFDRSDCSFDPLYTTPRRSPRLHGYLFPYWGVCRADQGGVGGGDLKQVMRACGQANATRTICGATDRSSSTPACHTPVLAHRGPARSLCAVLPLSETDHARSRRRTLSSGMTVVVYFPPITLTTRFQIHLARHPPRRLLLIVISGTIPVPIPLAPRSIHTPPPSCRPRRCWAPNVRRGGRRNGRGRQFTASTPPSFWERQGQAWGRLIASTASPPTGPMARFWASDIGPILTTSTLGLTPSRLGELTATGTTRGETTPPTVMSPPCRCPAITSPPSPAASFPPTSRRAFGGGSGDECEEAGLHGVQAWAVPSIEKGRGGRGPRLSLTCNGEKTPCMLRYTSGYHLHFVAALSKSCTPDYTVVRSKRLYRPTPHTLT
ncbi:hypothetical protein C8R46DRAFT_1044810 [Mycena filopes]|nr:hypothetical protein C8R46DRAFT_1044810 [Mycena filopes]